MIQLLGLEMTEPVGTGSQANNSHELNSCKFTVNKKQFPMNMQDELHRFNFIYTLASNALS